MIESAAARLRSVSKSIAYEVAETTLFRRKVQFGKLVGIFISSQDCIDPSKIFVTCGRNSPDKAKIRCKFAGTDVALRKSHNVEIASKGGELDRNGTTSATVFTLRLSVMLPSLKKSAALASLSAIGKAKPRKCFGDAMQNSQLANRFVMGHPAHAVPLAVKEETT